MTKEKAMEKTLALIKPDALRNGDTEHILQKIELSGFTIVTRARIQLTPERAGEFYAEHKGKPFYDNLVNFMSSGPLMAIVLAKSDAILAWRGLMGPTNTLKAREEAPHSLRALFGTDGTCNATHGSDSMASACREIRFFFPKLVQDPLPDSQAAKSYVQRELQPTLVKCLTTLCKVKPTADQLEAITWVANWLLDNNPNKPRPLSQDEAETLECEEEDADDEFEGEHHPEGDEGENAVNAMEEQLAATRLQSHFRGYQTRKSMKAKRNSVEAVIVHQVETNDADEAAAAVKVQSLYRGHKARKTVKAKKAEVQV